MRILAAILCCLAFSAVGANAQMKVKLYKENISSDDKMLALVVKTYVNGLGDGLFWSNVASEPKLYCQPGKLALDVDNYIRILNDEIERQAKLVTKAQLDDMPIGLLLLNGLQLTFPCKAGK